MDTLKFPLSFNRGRAVTLSENSDDYKAQAIALIARTRRGEMVLEPTYGITDPTFTVFIKSEFYRNVSTFWPEIKISDLSVSSSANAGGVVRLNVSFEGR
jgi:phage baseplate assembly protein W